ncbi:uncharacterized protein BDR25DRAFT_273895 [Lindgomyces ingoldianus]|uniref:Uncharacterized protein n=1 Tax=Lindgomyces ingoldianus TaxID=673940 RepID=A0ACB6Q818_9PLEO|nr:uncharacterized protein BDR25DRAFT_273895 [Lindgomyces ingoldianus]KAF2462990.1 hypothetical protein BDR25DRAFT_273895 [Lindgomyces ingoldianus]
MTDNPKKRKQPSNNVFGPKRPRFTGRAAHNISASPTSSAYPNGEVNVSRFIRAHENEIKALESAMKCAKKGLMRRAFQDVPRDMRRRTAAHNPHRVPKRIRARTKREAMEDNVTVVKSKSGSGIGKGAKQWLRKEIIQKKKKARERRAKDDVEVTVTSDHGTEQGLQMNDISLSDPKKESAAPNVKRKKQVALAAPNKPPAKFRKRQVHKTWLPTHLFHTKRAHLTSPNEPLWRFAIPLSPAMKSYRLTHRAATLRGAVAWDMSYISTIGLHGTERSIEGLLKALHFAKGDSDEVWEERGKAKKWRAGLRAWEGWIHEREGNIPRKIAHVTVMWSARESVSKEKRKAFVRVHPSAFLQLWNEVVRASKVQKPTVAVEDLRFEIGSLEVIGPAATEALCSVLHPYPTRGDFSEDAPQSIWPTLASITDPRVMPANALLNFSIVDPRLRYPPRTAKMRPDDALQSQLMETLAYWPIDKSNTDSLIFSRDARLAAGRSLPSQKSINRRKSTAPPGEYPDPRSSDPQIPMLAYVSTSTNAWTVLLPWKCVAPVWRSLMFYPVSTGGNLRFGGLLERRQVNFERSVPYFPFDCPGTDAGWGWELQERVERENQWRRKPKGKRIEWTTINLGKGKKGEVGSPWACQWEMLLPKLNQGGETSGDTTAVTTATSPFLQLSSEAATTLILGHSPVDNYLASPYVFAAKITMIQRGVPTNCARVYRLPSNDPELRKKWLSLISTSKHSSPPAQDSEKRQNMNSKDVPRHIRNRALAASLLEPKQPHGGPPKAGDDQYPVVPDEPDLIGFVTSGNYNLAEGKPTAIANLVLQRVFGLKDTAHARRAFKKEDHVCIVREAGASLGRLGTWEVAMSEDKAAGEQPDGARAAVTLSPDALAGLTKDIVEDTLYNIIHSTVLSCHRSEKLVRMQSAATQAENVALSTLEPQPQAKGSSSQPAQPTAETAAAKYENGRVHLKGNPLKTTPEITCPHCKLPRLMHPIMGKGMQNPDLTKEYCMLYPWVQRQGHDVYGNPFPTDMAKSKKERELIKQQQKNAEKESVGTPGSQDTDMAGGEGSTQGKEIKLNTGGKPASYIPWHTCPNCKRSLLITRFAQHLEKCLGISGRQSSRNAMAKLAGQNGNGSGTGMGNTPLGSRMGTPAPGSQSDPIIKSKGKGVSPVKRLGDDDDEGENETPEKRKKKKSSYVKKADRLAKEGGGTLKVKIKANSQNKEHASKDSDRKASESTERSEGKRDRDDGDADGAPMKKKIKLSLGKGESTSVQNGSQESRSDAK